MATAAAVALGWTLALAPAIPAPKFPELTGRIVDNAGLLTAADKAVIESDLAALEAKSTDQIAVVTVPTLDGYTIEDYGYQLGRHWGIGQAGKDNGALLIVAPNERKVRIEIGRRLEPLLTDTMSALIVQNSILPRFRRGDFSGGIRAGVTDMKDVLLGDAEAVKERAKGGRQDGQVDWVALILIAIWVSIVIYVIYAQYRQAQQFPNSSGRYRRTRAGRDDGGIVVIPGGSGGWDSDWGDSGGSGGGGWSGGGGGFGGGGASGSW
ncbi:MAG: TPM domain-containing protein [Hyphomicrobium sp.]